MQRIRQGHSVSLVLQMPSSAVFNPGLRPTQICFSPFNGSQLHGSVVRLVVLAAVEPDTPLGSRCPLADAWGGGGGGGTSHGGALCAGKSKAWATCVHRVALEPLGADQNAHLFSPPLTLQARQRHAAPHHRGRPPQPALPPRGDAARAGRLH